MKLSVVGAVVFHRCGGVNEGIGFGNIEFGWACSFSAGARLHGYERVVRPGGL